MPKIYRLSRTGIRLLYKVRHHKGHGIHSPFVFDLITKVIEEKHPYYAYEDIRLYLEGFPSLIDTQSKKNRLIFRIINRFCPQKILELGAGCGISTLYLTALSRDIKCRSVEQSQEKAIQAKAIYKNWHGNIQFQGSELPNLEEKQDCIYLNLVNYKFNIEILIGFLLNSVKEESFIIIDGIRTNRECRTLWKSLIDNDTIVISLDLYHLGILFFNKKYFKQNYKLSF